MCILFPFIAYTRDDLCRKKLDYFQSFGKGCRIFRRNTVSVFCKQCKSYYCKQCSSLRHKHSKRTHHEIRAIAGKANVNGIRSTNTNLTDVKQCTDGYQTTHGCNSKDHQNPISRYQRIPINSPRSFYTSYGKLLPISQLQ